jgi:hypothetical protein
MYDLYRPITARLEGRAVRLPRPQERCFRFVGVRASLVLKSEAMLEVPEGVMIELVSRDDLCAPEVTISVDVLTRTEPPTNLSEILIVGQVAIFELVQRWVAHSPTRVASAAAITAHLRLPLISLRDLMKVLPQQLNHYDCLLHIYIYISGLSCLNLMLFKAFLFL